MSLIKNFQTATTHFDYNNKIYVIISEANWCNFDDIQDIVGDREADIFLELPYHRKRSPYLQSWIQYLYSNDFSMRKYLPALRGFFPQDYDKGLNSLYKKLKPCLYETSKYDIFKKCPFNLDQVKLHAMDIFQQDIKKAKCSTNQQIFIDFLTIIKRIRTEKLKPFIVVPQDLERKIISLAENIEKCKNFRQLLQKCLEIKDEPDKLLDDQIQKIIDEYKKYLNKYSLIEKLFLDDARFRCVKNIRTALYKISKILICRKALQEAKESKNKLIIFFVTNNSANLIRKILENKTLQTTNSKQIKTEIQSRLK